MIIMKTLYRLKSSRKRWHERLFDVLLSLGFTSTKAEEDIWIKDMGDHYDYIAVNVDDMIIALKNSKWIIEGLEAVPFSLKGTGPVTYHLGCDYFWDKHGTLCVGPRKYIEKMVGEYERLFGKKPSLKVRPPLKHNDHPELDTSPILDEDGNRSTSPSLEHYSEP
jgi:Reverse transcriptase (RNA-dependent DNA polymerase)